MKRRAPVWRKNSSGVVIAMFIRSSAEWAHGGRRVSRSSENDIGRSGIKKREAIFSTALIALVLLFYGCENAERETATEPAKTASPAVTPMITPETSASPATSPGEPSTGAPEWLADGATHSVAGITSAPKALIGKTVTVVAEVEDVYDGRAFKLDGGASLTGGVKKGLLALIPKVGGFPIIDEQWKNRRARVTGVVL